MWSDVPLRVLESYDHKALASEAVRVENMGRAAGGVMKGSSLFSSETTETRQWRGRTRPLQVSSIRYSASARTAPEV